MKNKWYILLFIVLIAISLFAFQYVAELLSDAPRSLSLETQYLLNLPACIFVGIVDFLIIVIVHKKLDNINNTMRIFIDLLLASVWVSCFGIAANYILSIILEEPWPEDYALLKMSLPVVLWNSMIVLLIEIFFYQQSQMEAEKKLAIIEKEKIQYQYETLKAQINPHFLFNSLNVLSSLAYSDAETAPKGIFHGVVAEIVRGAVGVHNQLHPVEDAQIGFGIHQKIPVVAVLPQTGTGEGLTINHFIRQAQFKTTCTYFVFEKLTQRFHKFELKIFRQTAYVVVRLHHLGRFRSAFHNIRVDSSLA